MRLKNSTNIFRIAFLLVLLFSSATLSAQKSKINLRHADKLKGNAKEGYQRLLGNVEFEHQGAIMHCDSAHLYAEKNTMDCFGHVHIQQGDSINLYGDLLKYDGNNRKAELFKNITLTDGDMSLKTEYLLYDLENKVASYNTGGRIVNKDNVLESKLGYYDTQGKVLTFRKNVKLTNPQYSMDCDTLRYLPVSKVAYFLGPTVILSKKNAIYCEDGWYDTKTDQSRFSKKSFINTEGRKLIGDSLFYDRRAGIGRAKGNITLIDTAQDIVINGDLAVHNELTERSLITGHALFIQAYEKDSLYLHADTLLAYTQHDSSMVEGKNGKKLQVGDSNRVVYAYHHVKFFKKDMQGKCDSMVYSSRDSIMKLFGKPVLWSDVNQLSAEQISIITTKGEIKEMFLEKTAFISSSEDSSRFNQIKGRKMTGHFSKNKLYRVDVEGNGQTLYYVHDKGQLIGVNKADCSHLSIFVKDDEVKSISFYNKPEATLYPSFEMSPKESLLKDFHWRGSERPVVMRDIFVE